MNKTYQNNDRSPNGASLLSSPHVYTMFVNNLPIGFTLVDRDGNILEFNPAAEALTGYSKDEVIGRSHFEIIHGSEDPSSCPLLTQVFEKHTPSIAAETAVKGKHGRTITLLVTVFPLFDISGNFIGGAELFRDISESKRLVKEHKNLLSMFAHDMKNPIVAAQGFLMRIFSGKAGPLTKKQKNYLSVTIGAIAKLQHLITDFLDYSAVEEKKYKPVSNPYNLQEAVCRQIEMIRPMAEEKDIKICFEYAQENLPVVYADGAMIDRVLSNLLDNAIQYTGPGGRVTVRIASRDLDVLVEVLDTGIGIDHQNIFSVFDAFYRANREVNGTGLGLSIAKAIIEAHHGVISVESTPGKGSNFCFTLPKNRP